MTPCEQFTEWLDECPCPWKLIEDHADSRTLKFFPDETHDEDEGEDEYDWRTHPSLTAAERNPSLR
jgi:hypothetical protein